MVEHHVEAQDMETGRVLEIIELNAFVDLVQAWLDSNQRFAHDVLDLVHKFVTVLALCFLQKL